MTDNNRVKYFTFIALITFVLHSFTQTLEAQNPDYKNLGISTAGASVPQGLKEGDKAPDFVAYDQTGKQVQLKKVLETGPVILFFYRGKWCPVCSRYLNNYQDSLKVLTDQGFNVLAITPESIENVEQTVKVHNLTFRVIYDCQEKIMKDFDVMFTVTDEYSKKIQSQYSIDIAANNGRDVAHLPVPATYIINRDGFIVAAWFNVDFNKQASVSWVIRNLGRAL